MEEQNNPEPLSRTISGIGKIAKALAAAQAEMHNPAFDSDNPFFKSKYASLATIRNACIPVLAKHNIATIQFLSAEGKDVSCTTTLLHESGEIITGPAFTLPAGKIDAQGLGSAATYARRYSLQAVVGLVGDADDDGNAACEPPTEKKKTGSRQDSKPTVTPPTEKAEETKAAKVVIKSITQKKGAGNTRYTITGEDDTTYNTFSVTVAETAKIAKGANLKVVVQYKETQYGKMIIDNGIEVTEEETIDAFAAETGVV